MTNVSPSNLKLIGRATFLILSHVTDMVARAALPFRVEYADANRILHMSIAFVRTLHEVQRRPQTLLTVVVFLQIHRTRRAFCHAFQYYFNRFAVAPLFSVLNYFGSLLFSFNTAHILHSCPL
jgi:hypothetical protein